MIRNITDVKSLLKLRGRSIESVYTLSTKETVKIYIFQYFVHAICNQYVNNVFYPTTDDIRSSESETFK